MHHLPFRLHTVAALCAVLVARKVLAGADADVFRWINHWPAWLYPPMWVVQLTGVIGAAPAPLDV